MGVLLLFVVVCCCLLLLPGAELESDAVKDGYSLHRVSERIHQPVRLLAVTQSFENPLHQLKDIGIQ